MKGRFTPEPLQVDQGAGEVEVPQRDDDRDAAAPGRRDDSGRVPEEIVDVHDVRALGGDDLVEELFQRLAAGEKPIQPEIAAHQAVHDDAVGLNLPAPAEVRGRWRQLSGYDDGGLRPPCDLRGQRLRVAFDAGHPIGRVPVSHQEDAYLPRQRLFGRGTPPTSVIGQA